MNIKKTLAGAALAIGLAALPVAAQEPGFHGGMRHGMQQGFGEGMLRHAAAVLQLTDAQQQFARQLAADTKKQAEPLSTELRQNREAIHAAVKANNTPEIRRISQRQGDLLGQLSALHGESMAKFYAQLTPEQKAKADELHQQIRERVKHFRESRGRGPRNQG